MPVIVALVRGDDDAARAAECEAVLALARARRPRPDVEIAVRTQLGGLQLRPLALAEPGLERDRAAAVGRANAAEEPDRRTPGPRYVDRHLVLVVDAGLGLPVREPQAGLEAAVRVVVHERVLR